ARRTSHNGDGASFERTGLRLVCAAGSPLSAACRHVNGGPDKSATAPAGPPSSAVGVLPVALFCTRVSLPRMAEAPIAEDRTAVVPSKTRVESQHVVSVRCLENRAVGRVERLCGM